MRAKKRWIAKDKTKMCNERKTKTANDMEKKKKGYAILYKRSESRSRAFNWTKRSKQSVRQRKAKQSQKKLKEKEAHQEK